MSRPALKTPEKSTISVRPEVRELAKHISLVTDTPINEVVAIALQRLKADRQIPDPPAKIHLDSQPQPEPAAAPDRAA